MLNAYWLNGKIPPLAPIKGLVGESSQKENDCDESHKNYGAENVVKCRFVVHCVASLELIIEDFNDKIIISVF